MAGLAMVSCIEGSISPTYIRIIYSRSIARGDFLFSRLSQTVNKRSAMPMGGYRLSLAYFVIESEKIKCYDPLT